jgi:HEAT repeat protein
MKVLVLITTFMLGIALLQATDPQRIKNIAHALQIGDASLAVALAKEGLQRDPQDNALRRLHIQALAHTQDEAALLKAFKNYREQFPAESLDEKLLEEIIWSIINHSHKSASPIIRLEGALLAFLANDYRGIARVLQGLYDPNSIVRAHITSLCAQAKDEVLQKKILALTHDDPSPEVRMEAIKAVGEMRLQEAKNVLYKILEAEGSTKEKLAIIEALVNITLHIDATTIEKLAQSDRALLRALACKLVLEYDAKSLLEYIIPLIGDSHYLVRMMALQCLGVVHVGILPKPLLDNLQSLCPSLAQPELSVATAWLLLTKGDAACLVFTETQFSTWLRSENRELRLLASCALAQAGAQGAAIALKEILHVQDDLVRINLAIGLIRQRIGIEIARKAIQDSLPRISERLAWKEEGIFRYLAPTSATHNANIPRFPETEDLLIRLELFGILATTRRPPTVEEVKHCLQDRTWGVSGAYAQLLLQEGDESIIPVLKTLLKNEEAEIALQAACILALFHQDSEALAILHNSYAASSRELKEHILLGIGAIGATASIPFLIQVLDEPFPTLRMRAAWAIHSCLVH